MTATAAQLAGPAAADPRQRICDTASETLRAARQERRDIVARLLRLNRLIARMETHVLAGELPDEAVSTDTTQEQT